MNIYDGSVVVIDFWNPLTIPKNMQKSDSKSITGDRTK